MRATRIGRKGLVLVMGAALVVAMGACGEGKSKSSGSSTSGSSGKPITIGTTDNVIALDPAGSYDNGSLLLEDNIYQFLMNVPAGAKAPQPDAAQSCSFTSPTNYTCKLKPNQKFSNGDVMTSADVVFSFNRINKINDPNGPASLIGNMASVAAPDANTVVFTLKNPNDQTWPFVLGTSAGPIVDSKVFPADKELPDAQVIGSGPYKITNYDKNQLVRLAANPNYVGPNKAKTSDITLKYYTQSQNLKLDVQSGAIDIAWRSMTPTDVNSLKSASGVKVLTGSGGELRYLVFNLKTMPGGTTAKQEAIRHAMAYSVDRQALATDVYKGTYQPAYSMIPNGIAGATEAFKDAYGSAPDKAKAAQRAAAGRRLDAGQAQHRLHDRPLRPDLGPGVRRDQASARGDRPVQGQPVLDRVGDLQPGPGQGHLPDLPAGLVPGLRRR